MFPGEFSFFSSLLKVKRQLPPSMADNQRIRVFESLGVDGNPSFLHRETRHLQREDIESVTSTLSQPRALFSQVLMIVSSWGGSTYAERRALIDDDGPLRWRGEDPLISKERISSWMIAMLTCCGITTVEWGGTVTSIISVYGRTIPLRRALRKQVLEMSDGLSMFRKRLTDRAPKR